MPCLPPTNTTRYHLPLPHACTYAGVASAPAFHYCCACIPRPATRLPSTIATICQHDAYGIHKPPAFHMPRHSVQQRGSTDAPASIVTYRLLLAGYACAPSALTYLYTSRQTSRHAERARLSATRALSAWPPSRLASPELLPLFLKRPRLDHCRPSTFLFRRIAALATYSCAPPPLLFAARCVDGGRLDPALAHVLTLPWGGSTVLRVVALPLHASAIPPAPPAPPSPLRDYYLPAVPA